MSNRERKSVDLEISKKNIVPSSKNNVFIYFKVKICYNIYKKAGENMLSSKLIELRKSRGLTQDELATKLFISRSMVAKYETNKAYPTNEVMQRIANYFEISIDELTTKEELIDKQSKASDNERSKNKIIAILISIIGILNVLMVAIMLEIDVDTIETEVDMVA